MPMVNFQPRMAPRRIPAGRNTVPSTPTRGNRRAISNGQQRALGRIGLRANRQANIVQRRRMQEARSIIAANERAREEASRREQAELRAVRAAMLSNWYREASSEMEDPESLRTKIDAYVEQCSTCEATRRSVMRGALMVLRRSKFPTSDAAIAAIREAHEESKTPPAVPETGSSPVTTLKSFTFDDNNGDAKTVFRLVWYDEKELRD